MLICAAPTCYISSVLCKHSYSSPEHGIYIVTVFRQGTLIARESWLRQTSLRLLN